MAKGHWKLSEDVKLRDLVALHGPRNWNLISEQFPGRSGEVSLLFSYQNNLTDHTFNMYDKCGL